MPAYSFYTPVSAPVSYAPPTAKRKPGALSQAPIYSPNGLVTGYRSDPTTAAMLGLTQKDSSALGNDRVALVGTDPMPYAPTGSATAAKPGGDPNKDFTSLRATKNPDIAAAGQKALGDAQANADAASKGYQDYLTEFKQQQDANKTALATDRKTLSDTTDYAKALADAEKAYATNEGNTNQQIADANARYQKQQQDALAALQANNAQYETAAQNVANLAVSRADAGNKIYQTVSGTPTSDSGDMRGRAIRAYTDVNVPLQADLANRRERIIENVQMPLNAQYRANEAQRLEGFQGPMYGTEAQMSTADANAVEQLRVALAGRSMDESLRYMQSLGVPLQLQQAVLSGSLANLGAASNLIAGNEFYGLSTPYNNPGLSLPDYNPGNPPLRAPGSYASPVSYGPTPVGDAGNPPIAGAPKRSNVVPGQKQPNGFTVTNTPVERLARQIYAQNMGADPASDPNYFAEAYRQAFAEASARITQPQNYPTARVGYPSAIGPVPTATPEVYAAGGDAALPNDADPYQTDTVPFY